MGIRKELRAWIDADRTRDSRLTLQGIERILTAPLAPKAKPIFKLVITDGPIPGVSHIDISQDDAKLTDVHIIGAVTAIKGIGEKLMKPTTPCGLNNNPLYCGNQCEGCVQ